LAAASSKPGGRRIMLDAMMKNSSRNWFE